MSTTSGLVRSSIASTDSKTGTPNSEPSARARSSTASHTPTTSQVRLPARTLSPRGQVLGARDHAASDYRRPGSLS